jgi:hypothetical protein
VYVVRCHFSCKLIPLLTSGASVITAPEIVEVPGAGIVTVEDRRRRGKADSDEVEDDAEVGVWVGFAATRTGTRWRNKIEKEIMISVLIRTVQRKEER